MLQKMWTRFKSDSYHAKPFLINDVSKYIVMKSVEFLADPNDAVILSSFTLS